MAFNTEIYRRCASKVAHQTEAEAKQGGLLPYKCKFCGLWHCTSAGVKLQQYAYHEATVRKIAAGNKWLERHKQPRRRSGESDEP